MAPTFVVVGILALPLVTAFVSVLAHGYTPSGDNALIELLVRDVGPNAPLVGPYSRYGWNHPGPMLFYILAVPYRALGGSGAALLASQVLLNAASIVGILVVAQRRGGRALVFATTGALTLWLFAIGPTFLSDPWNPYCTLLPFGLLVLLTWSLWEHDRWALPAFALVGSFLVQSHIGYAGVVGVLACWSAIGFVRASRRLHTANSSPHVWKASGALIAGTALILVMCWVPVAIDVVRGGDNLSNVSTYFRTDKAGAGPVIAAEIAARELGPRAPWTSTPEPIDPRDGGMWGDPPRLLILPLAAMAISAWWARRRRVERVGHLQAAVVLTTVGAAVATTRASTPVYAYMVKWWWIVGMLWWLSVAWALWRTALPATRERLGVALAPVMIVAIAVLSVMSARVAWTTIPATNGWGDRLEPLSAAAIERMPRTGALTVRTTGSVWGTAGDTLRNELDRAGIPFVVEPVEAYKYGRDRSSAQTAPTATVWVVTGDAIDTWATRADTCPLATWDPLTNEHRARYRALAAQLTPQFRALGRRDLETALLQDSSLWDAIGVAGIDQDSLRELEGYRAAGKRTSIFLEASDGPTPCARPPAQLIG